MPQVQNFEDDRIRAEVNFRGLRKYKIFRWLPFMTGCHPSLSLKVYLKKEQFTVKAISIPCEAPKLRDNSIWEGGYGWSAKDIRIGEEYKIAFPMLDRAGNYEYTLDVGIERQHEGQPSSTHSIGKIMSTGKVYWQEHLGVAVFSLLIGCGLSFLIQWLVSL